MPAVFLVSDTHFGHAGVCHFTRNDGVTKLRPWTDPDEMDEEMVKRWNETVRPNDKVYHLGDVVINRKALKIMSRLNGDKVLRGQVLIAPGGKHMLVKRSGAIYHVEVIDGPLVNRHRPSVDVLFRSVARFAGKNAVAAILTGMGDDGARGMLEMKEAGAFTVAQDEKTCVVFGMPKEAIKLGGVDKVVPLSEVTKTLLSKVKIV